MAYSFSSGSNKSSKSTVSTPVSKNMSTEGSSDSVSMTFSKYATDNIDGDINTQILSYDCFTKEIKKVFEFEYTAQYPLGYYDKQSQLVYYTKRVGNDGKNYGDQIFCTDLANNKEKQLTDTLFAVNYIIPTKDFLFFAARPKDSKILKLGSINKKTGKMSYWGDEDTIIEAMTIDKKNQKIFVSTYSMKERNYNLIHQDGPVGQDNYKMPKHTVFQTNYNFTETKELFSENLWIRTIMYTGDNLVALCDKKYNNAEVTSTVFTYNLNNSTLTKKEWEAQRMQVGDSGYSSDGKKIYAISVVDNKRGLYEYNIEEKKYTPIFTPDNGFVNNIQVVIN